MNANTASLCGAYQPYFPIGAAVNPRTLRESADILATHFNSVTAENEMKFERLHPYDNVFDFEESDALVRFASGHRMKVRGHTLVWHNQTPDWVFRDREGEPASPELLLHRMEDHIRTVVQRYRGRVYCWDVVNEAVADEGEAMLRPSPWLDILGESFIGHAFEIAHRADPDALLFYNDYNETNPRKRDKVYALLKSLLERDVPIHGMGMQGHWGLQKPEIGEIRAAIELYASLGLQIQITELDLSVFEWNDRRTDLTCPEPYMMECQAQRYEDIFALFREYKDVIKGVTFWGVSDRYTWLDDFPVKGRKNWPFLFDVDDRAKDAFWRVIQDA